MSLWKIAWRSIEQRSLASALTAFSMALGVALVVAVLVIHSVVTKSFERGSQGYDLIVGAKGSQLQLVLNSVFYLGQPIENVPYKYYEEFVEGRFSPAVEAAIPICMGHAYKDYPVVATVPDYFEKLTYLNGQKYRFAEGRDFEQENFYEAVIGATAAKRSGLGLGDTFQPVGTASGDEGHEGHDPFKIVGILAPTGTPNDRAIFVNMEGFFRCPAHNREQTTSDDILREQDDKSTTDADTAEETSEAPATEKADDPADHEHDDAEPADHEHADHNDADHDHADHDHADHEHGDHDHEHGHFHREVTAILVCSDMQNRPQLAMALPEVINEENAAQAVAPAEVIAKLFDGIVGNIQLLLLVLAVLVVVVAGIGILVSIYNSMSDRRHEIAVMRALGASRDTVMLVILMESILLSLGGGVLGLLLGHGLIGLLGPTIAEQTGVIVGALQFQVIELVLIPGLIILATLVGYLPAVSAYRTDVAKSLAAS